MQPRLHPFFLAGLFACWLAAMPASAGRPHHRHTETGSFPSELAAPSESYVDSPPPLWDNLGTLSYPITTVSARAQRYFDQGLRLTYAFNHLEAQRAFRMAQKLDPACALCYWGEALVLGPNINAPMSPSAAKPAWSAVARAKALAGKTSIQEKGLIEALAQRYAKNPQADRAALDRAYAKAMGRLAARFPEDQQIAVLYAESLMDLSPWNYWTEAGRRPTAHAAESLRMLEKVLAQNPDHPGAIHYYIHIMESSDHPERAEPHARRLAGLMSGAGHLVHMPGHLYYRLGHYRDALEANRAAVAVDEAYLRETGAKGLYAQGYYPHNVHFLTVSAQMAGEGETAVAAAGKLAAIVDDEMVRKVPWLQPVKAAPYFAHAQYSERESIMKLPDPGPGFPYVQAAWRYARGVASTASGRLDDARTELAELTRITRTADFAALTSAGVPATEVARIAEKVLSGRIAQAEGKSGVALNAFESAAAIQDRLPYMEPPFWYYPVRRSVGAQMLLDGDLAGARRELAAALERSPNDVWTLQALAVACEKLGDKAGVEKAERQLQQASAGKAPRVELRRL